MTSNRFIYLILLAFIAGNLLLVFMQFNSAKNLDNLISGNDKLLYELKVSNQLREAEKNLLSVESKIRGCIATNDTSYLETVNPLTAETRRYLDSIKKSSNQDSTSRNIDLLYELTGEQMALKNQVLDSYYHSGSISRESFNDTLRSRININGKINDLSRRIYDSHQRLINALSLSISNSGKKARYWGNIMIILVLMSEAGLFWYIISRIRRQNHLIQELDASEKRVREVSIVKENFMANMSHEIRTPMNAILGFTNLMKNKNRDPEMTEFIESIQKSGDSLLTIINDILDVSKIEAGKIQIESAPFGIRGLTQCVQTLLTGKVNEKGLQFSTTIDDSIPDTLSGDATRLMQILVNMIGNAIKFTNDGAIHVEINNKGMDTNHILLEFVVSDTGIGIAKDKLSGIFDRFQQAEDSITRKYGGTGLGLSIAKDLVLLQKGEIRVESEPGKGTIFRFTIPYEIAANQLVIPHHLGLDGFENISAQDIHILAVEDNEMNQNLLKHLFKEWKLSADIVNNGIEAIEQLQAKRYDLVLMDIQMPEMDGYTATQEIRRKLKMDIPIIAMTAHAFAGEREKCLSYGMNEYIAKPINERLLSNLIIQFTGITNTLTLPKEKISNEQLPAYQFIDLHYMRDISMGNKEYEKSVTEQFIESTPLDIETLETALKNSDLVKLRQTAHNMKTNVSVMGLTEKLQPYLDILEYEPYDEERFEQTILSVKTICTNALPEANHFYSTFLKIA